jgi:hypothetical protein
VFVVRIYFFIDSVRKLLDTPSYVVLKPKYHKNAEVLVGTGREDDLGTKQNFMHEEIKSILILGMLLFFSASFVLLSPLKNLKIKVHRTTILPVGLYG